MPVFKPRTAEPATSDEAARAYLEEHRDLLHRSRSDLLQDPDIPLARESLRAQLAEMVKPLLEAKLKLAVLRLQWSLWDELDERPGDLFQQVGGFETSPRIRAAEADQLVHDAEAEVTNLETEETFAALILLNLLDERDRSTGTQA
jgi:hypothetical protein